MEDVDGDGDLYMVFRFKVGETGIAPGDTQATLTGRTFDGTFLSGPDEIEESLKTNVALCSLFPVMISNRRLVGRREREFFARLP